MDDDARFDPVTGQFAVDMPLTPGAAYAFVSALLGVQMTTLIALARAHGGVGPWLDAWESDVVAKIKDMEASSVGMENETAAMRAALQFVRGAAEKLRHVADDQ
jgi:hypothetical protein